MDKKWPELIALKGRVFTASGEQWTIRHAAVLEDQQSTRLALLLDLQKDSEIFSIRLLFPSEVHAVEHGENTDWLIESLQHIIESRRLRQEGIYSIENPVEQE